MPAEDHRRPGRRTVLAWMAATGLPLAACTADEEPSADGAPGSSATSAPAATVPGAPTVTTPTTRQASPPTTPPRTATPRPRVPPTIAPGPSGPLRAFTVAVCGDVLLHSGLWAQAARDAAGAGERYDFRPMLAGLAPVVGSADLAIAHLETPVGRPSGPFSGYPSFMVPPAILPALEHVGFAGVSTASNHSLDAGVAGIGRTIEAVRAAGLLHAGTATSAAQSQQTTLFAVAGVSVALLSYTYGFNGYRLPAGRSWAANLIDVPAMLQAARRARGAGAAVVMVAVHAGEQYVQQPNTEQRQVFRALTASADVDFVYGHHAHVAQPVTRVNGKLVAYGLGNAVADQRLPHTRDGMTALVRMTPTAAGRYAVTSVTPVPTWMSDTRPLRWLDARPPAGGSGAHSGDLRSAARWVTSAAAARVTGA